MIIKYEIEYHWRMFFKDNEGDMDNEKVITHTKRWDVYMNEKQ